MLLVSFGGLAHIVEIKSKSFSIQVNASVKIQSWKIIVTLSGIVCVQMLECMHGRGWVDVCFYVCVTLLTPTDSKPAAEQQELAGLGSLVRGLTLPSNRVPTETRHKACCCPALHNKRTDERLQLPSPKP